MEITELFFIVGTACLLGLFLVGFIGFIVLYKTRQEDYEHKEMQKMLRVAKKYSEAKKQTN
jgi:hypothetical protein